jgi:hypothetical protein
MIVMRDRPLFQFGLSSLLWAVTVIAVLLSTAITCFEAFWRIVALALAIIASFCVLVAGVEVFLWIKNPSPNADPYGGKLAALFRSRYFWMSFCLALSIALCLNIIPYYLSHGVYGPAGCEVAGWPLDFRVCGGFVCITRFDALALFVDMLVVIAVAAATGIGFRNGAGPFLRRARILIRKARTWPRDDDG